MAKVVTHKNNKPYFGDESLLKIATERKFSDMIFELLSEKKPTKPESKIFETILNISIDHGSETPSAVETIKEAKQGKSMSESVSAGILEINERHGGAVENAMELLYEITNDTHGVMQSLQITNFVRESIENNIKLPGFGHRFYETDPRTVLLFNLLKENNFSDKYIKIAGEIEKELERVKGKKLPINVDGAIAVVFCTLNWDEKSANTVFLIARTPGLVGQYLNHYRT